MPSSQPASLTPAVVFQLLRDHRWLWIGPALAGFVLAAGASLVTPRQWKATQGFIVRSETAGFADQRLGKFTDLSEMKTVQETVLEVARSQRVLTAALQEVGPPPSWFSRPNWPTAEDALELREQLSITPPGGAEFGSTEVFYLSVLNADSDRAVAIAGALASQLEVRMQEIRNQQADSMTRELEHATAVARRELQERTNRLSTMEAEVGAHLGDLRNLLSSIGGQGALAQQTLSIEAELRDSEASRRRNTELLATLEKSQDNPRRLLATSSTLLASQPALQRLKDGLIDAQVRAASLEGTRSATHPHVIAAKQTVQLLRQRLHAELPTAIVGVEMELSLSRQREAALQSKLSQVNQQGRSLAGRRAEYSQLVSAVENQTRVVDVVAAQLSDARAYAAGVKSASVLARVDAVEPGNRPVGPGRASVALAGGLGGLVLGLGLVFLFFAPQTPSQTPAHAVTDNPATPAATPEAAIPQELAPKTSQETTVRPFGEGKVANEPLLPAWTEMFPAKIPMAAAMSDWWNDTKA